MKLAWCAALVAATVGLVNTAGSELTSRDVYLMGTRAHLAVYAPTPKVGHATLEAALRVLETAEGELSTWREGSLISSLNRADIGSPWHAPAPLCAMFQTVFDLRAQTRGAFDPALGPLIEAWDIHGTGRVPDGGALARARARSGLEHLLFDDTTCELTRQADVTLDVGAFGKGEALDRVTAAIGAGPWMIDLGGQIAIGGPMPAAQPWIVSIAHPAARASAYLEVHLTHGSLATSAGSERDQIVDGERVGHVLDPRTGHPALFAGSVSVWHRSGLVADALSTALYVMGPDEGVRWAESRDISAGFLIPDKGEITVAMTSGFRRLLP